jgi:hypothetical protein
MVSKLTREKLEPLMFKFLLLKLERIKFKFNLICVAYENRNSYPKYDYKPLKEENNSCIEESLNDFVIDLKEIKKYCKGFYLEFNLKSAYYLYPLITEFKNLSDLKIKYCDIPYCAFVNIGKTLPNLTNLEMQSVNLVKSPTDNISTIDIVFPPNLAYLRVSLIQIITTPLLLDPYECLFNNKTANYTYEDFIMPRIPLPSLKHLEFRLKGQQNHELEDLIKVNSNLELLLTRNYNLNIDYSLNSLKCLDIDEKISLNSIDQAPTLNSINTMTFLITNFNYIENIIKICKPFPNLIELNIQCNARIQYTQKLNDCFLIPALPNLLKLKTLRLINIPNVYDTKILDFSNFTQIEKLEVSMWKLTSNIKFNNCKSLKQIKFESVCCSVVKQQEFMEKFNSFRSWNFNFGSYIVNGYKI